PLLFSLRAGAGYELPLLELVSNEQIGEPNKTIGQFDLLPWRWPKCVARIDELAKEMPLVQRREFVGEGHPRALTSRIARPQREVAAKQATVGVDAAVEQHRGGMFVQRQTHLSPVSAFVTVTTRQASLGPR